MQKRKGINWRFLIIIFLIILSLWNEGTLEDWTFNIQKFFWESKEGVVNVIKNIVDVFTIYKNIALEKDYWEKKAEELLKENVLLKLNLENIKRYQEVLIFGNKFKNFDIIPALIIGRDPLNWNLSFRINLGKKDGIKENMPVIYEDQLIGKIRKVSMNFSEVETIYNPSFSIGVVIYETKDQGVIKGAIDHMELSYLFSDNGIKDGYQVVTSGIDEDIPYGIKVGYISEINKNTVYFLPKVKVLSFIDISKLGVVMVCKTY
ncbi:MAG: rod shape-determining protein MreC [Dictyoglomus sp. NZ13-RE01]|nr:MAG: rod shape-determining protein MreC [Dictyoglomus sp. NZ13-RE01]